MAIPPSFVRRDEGEEAPGAGLTDVADAGPKHGRRRA